MKSNEIKSNHTWALRFPFSLRNLIRPLVTAFASQSTSTRDLPWQHQVCDNEYEPHTSTRHRFLHGHYAHSTHPIHHAQATFPTHTNSTHANSTLPTHSIKLHSLHSPHSSRKFHSPHSRKLHSRKLHSPHSPHSPRKFHSPHSRKLHSLHSPHLSWPSCPRFPGGR